MIRRKPPPRSGFPCSGDQARRTVRLPKGRSRRHEAVHDDLVDTTSSTAIVEAGWQAVRTDGRVRTALLAAAYAEPRLRQLFPWTGMGELHFSRCTEYRHTWDIPYIQPATGGGYWVSGPSARSPWDRRIHPNKPSRWSSHACRSAAWHDSSRTTTLSHPRDTHGYR
ncbi:DUF6193 family natural product biosynthesis protein [Streptomyces sp. BE147]|uniref:DUF6193 family natural product biosynthesis protein n=1 Tax=Streptomyces sp. BE147 TaxID=3002524 RepID=UPI002E77B2EB|nr:DUF6193 family natural product biosynthesis protein [Streptomyces sp. BE147]MEE1735589.1 DUF6193 family natural product biosynthesis protein [Streptomyces sp. BE147]